MSHMERDYAAEEAHRIWLNHAMKAGVRHFFPEITDELLEEAVRLTHCEVEPMYPNTHHAGEHMRVLLEKVGVVKTRREVEQILRSIRWSIVCTRGRDVASYETIIWTLYSLDQTRQ